MSLVELARCSSRIEAALMQGLLESEGIASFLFDAEMSWVGDALLCRLMVDDEDLAPARKIIASAESG